MVYAGNLTKTNQVVDKYSKLANNSQWAHGLILARNTKWLNEISLFQYENLKSNLYIKFHLVPSSIYSCSIGHIWEHEFCHLGSLGRIKKFLKRWNFCLSMLLFEVVFSTFYRQKKKNFNF